MLRSEHTDHSRCMCDSLLPFFSIFVSRVWLQSSNEWSYLGSREAERHGWQGYSLERRLVFPGYFMYETVLSIYCLLDRKSAHALIFLLDASFYWWYWQYLRLSKVTRWFLVAIMLAGGRSLMFTCAREQVSSISSISQKIGVVTFFLQSAHRWHVRNCFASRLVEDVEATTYLHHLPRSVRIRTSWFLFHSNL